MQMTASEEVMKTKLINNNGKQITAKEYLQQIYHINWHIIRLQQRRDDIRKDLYAVKSPAGSMDADKVQTSMSGDTMLRMIAKADEAERDIVTTLNHLMDVKTRITEQIEALDDERYKTLLLKRYVLLMHWEQIAVDMNYRIKWIYDLHGQALAAFADVWGSETGK